MAITSESELKNILLYKCREAIMRTQEDIYRVIDSCLDQFYGEFTPAEYIRTKKLLYSLVLGEVKQVGNSFIADVYFDANQLDYALGMMPLQHTPEHGRYGWNGFTGEQVLEIALTGGKPHGNYAKGTAIWIESMKRLGNIYEILKKELIAQGFSVK